MPSYELHSHGAEVSRIQTALRTLGLYAGPVDGDFGGGTLAAVRAFQRSKGLQVDWDLGQGTLQPLLTEMTQTHAFVLQQIFTEHYPELQAKLGADREEQLAWARSIQAPPWRHLLEPWRGYFKTLGRRPECQDLELKYAQRYYDQGLALCTTFDVHSERAVALMFDISVQNGGIKEPVTTRIKRDFATLDSGLGTDDLEVGKLRIIANRRAEAASRRWVEDVRARKLTITNGEGVVHGRRYELETQYGIRLT